MVSLMKTLCIEVLEITVFLGVPPFFVVTTMGLHHSTGVPTGTGVIMPWSTSRSNESFMTCFHCMGIGMGVCLAYGLACGLR